MGDTNTVFLYSLLSLARGYKRLSEIPGKAFAEDSPSLFRRLAWIFQDRRSATLR